MSEFEQEEKIKAALEKEFKGAVQSASVQRKNRVWAEVETAKLPEIAAWLKAEGFDHVATVTGFDEGENLGAIYHTTDQKMVLNLRVRTPRSNPSIPSLMSVYPGILSYERELEDMFGIKIQGLPPGRRYPLPDDFPTDQYPLRKDWKTADFLAQDPLLKEGK